MSNNKLNVSNARLRRSRTLVAAVLLICLASLTRPAGAQKQEPLHRGFMRLERGSEALNAALNSPVFTATKNHLNDRGYEIATERGLIATREGPDVQAFLFPVDGPSNNLLEAIPIGDGAPSRVTVEQYNNKYTAQNVSQSYRWMLFIHRPEIEVPFILEALTFADDSNPVFVLSTQEGGRLVFNFEEGILYTVDSLPSGPQGISISSLNFGAFWTCLKQVLGIPSSSSILDIVNSLCTFPPQVQTIIALANSCTDCITIIGCEDCVIGWAAYLICATAQVAQCYSQTPDPGTGGQGTCSNPISLTAGQSFDGNTSGGQSSFGSYGCISSWSENGPERVHRITLSSSGTISAQLTNLSADLDVAILSSCSSNSCLAEGDNSASANVGAGTYYIVVDGYNGAVGSYRLTVNVSGGGSPNPTPHVDNVTALSTPIPGQQFTARIDGTGFDASTVRVVVTGATSCQTFGACSVPNNVLHQFGSVTSNQITNAPLTLAAGSYQIYVQNGTAGPQSNGFPLTVQSGGSGTTTTLNGSVSQGNSWTATFNVPSGRSLLRATLTWSSSDDLDLHLRTPGGVNYGYGETNPPYYTGALTNPEIMEFTNPQSGSWQLRVYGWSVTGTRSFTLTIQAQ